MNLEPRETPPPPPQVVRVRPAKPNAASVRQLSRTERWVETLTQWQVALPIALVCAGMTTWSLAFRLPSRPAPLAVQAREWAPKKAPEKVYLSEEITLLRSNASLATSRLVTDKQEITQALANLERTARQQGFLARVSMKTPIPAAYGFKDLLILPALIQLENEGAQKTPAYQRLLRWLDAATQSPRKIELSGLQLRSNQNGVIQAEVELQFWSHDASKETTSK